MANMFALYRYCRHASVGFGPAFLILLIIALSFVGGCSKKHVIPRSDNDDLPRLTGPINVPNPPTPVPLTAATVDDFLAWVQRVPVSNTALIRQLIAQAATDDAVVDELAKRLFEIPIQNIGRHLMILSILGETRNPHAVAPLVRFIWLDRPLVDEPTEMLGVGTHTSRFNYNSGLKARAVEMLAYIGTNDALAGTRDAISKHADAEVRISAMDAYLFNHNDSEESKAELRRIARPDEAKLIGIPRRTRDMDVKAFDVRVQTFYERYPEERPPVPQQTPQHDRDDKAGLPRLIPAMTR
jgi:hypothetical protein